MSVGNDPAGAEPLDRPINYLRLSVTDRCNLRCVYCMPPEGIRLLPQENILRYGEILEIMETVRGPLGIHGVRITGGEPLVRGGVEVLVSGLSRVNGLDDLAMTTNGLLLAEYAPILKKAGLKRVNISLDTIRPDRFREICRGGELEQVWEGIRAAEEESLLPVKINVVLIPGLNDDELVEMAALTLEEPWHVRFIEFMPVGNHGLYHSRRYLPSKEAMAILKKFYRLQPVDKPGGLGPARYWKIEGSRGSVGFISPISNHFCDGCNRIRLTADGWIRVCLLKDRLGVDIKTPFRAGARGEVLVNLFREAIRLKPHGHDLEKDDDDGAVTTMCQIGG
jgi:cyclic pyranopterin phosphate synthase